MPVRKLDDVKIGEVLGQDVANPQGSVLAKAGITLEEKHLRLLRMWGVEAVRVAGEGDADPSTPPDADCDTAEAEIKRRFGPSLDNEVMADILRVAVIQHAGKRGGGERA